MMPVGGAVAIRSIVLGLIAAVAMGLTGSFALMRRITLAGDVISHVALPGIGLAFLFGVNPTLGGAATLFAGTIVIAKLEEHTGLTTDTMIGVVFAASLALGALVTPVENLEEALFGSFIGVSVWAFVAGVGATAVVIAALWRQRHRMILHVFSPELATTLGIDVRRLNLVFMLLFSLTVLLGLQFLGALLASALIMIPPTIARRLTHRLSHFLVISSGASAISLMGGFLIAGWRHLPLGPAVVLVACALFGVSLFMRER
jgi:ABC-type Mn2+/Zn2+ transport system permease subunit